MSQLDQTQLPKPGWLKFADRPNAVPKTCKYSATVGGKTVYVPHDREPDFARFVMLTLDEFKPAQTATVTGNTAMLPQQ